jgi:hypothetical protein
MSELTPQGDFRCAVCRGVLYQCTDCANFEKSIKKAIQISKKDAGKAAGKAAANDGFLIKCFGKLHFCEKSVAVCKGNSFGKAKFWSHVKEKFNSHFWKSGLFQRFYVCKGRPWISDGSRVLSGPSLPSRPAFYAPSSPSNKSGCALGAYVLFCDGET